MSGHSTGTDSKTGAKSREHSHGRQDRNFTPEQHSAVQRICRCQETAYYEILSIEKDATEDQIKRAYRKVSLQIHPDKNGAPGADDAFKRASKAFQVLSDPQKRRIYDQTGADPESRAPPMSSGMHGGGGGAGSPFAGHPFASAFAGSPFDGDMDPAELFNLFFGGGGGMGGTTFTFGGPGIRVHQFGGAGPRMRARQPPRAQHRQNQPGGEMAALLRWVLPLLLLVLVPLLGSLFEGMFQGPQGPRFNMELRPPYTHLQQTARYDIPYFVNPKEWDAMGKKERAKFDRDVEARVISDWNTACRWERNEKERRIQESIGVLWTDERALKKAKEMRLPSCEKLKDAEERRRNLLETRNGLK